MEAQSCVVRFSLPRAPLAICFTEMFETDYASSKLELYKAVQTGPRLEPRQPPLSPNRAFARSKAKVANLSKSAKRKPLARNRRVSVMVVDDVADVTEMIALLLKHAGYKVATADSAAAALRLAGARNFDLIISDIGMPEMNGYELATALRGLADYQKIPIIAVTGYSEYDDRGRAIEAGFNAHLTKPINPTQLLDLMNDLLG